MLVAAWAASSAAAYSIKDNAYAARSVPGQRLTAPPVIDGDISDPVWQEAAMGDTFVDRVTGEPIEDQTRFWLGYDDTAIYFAIHCFDPEPDKLLMRETKRDGNVWADDHVAFVLDPFHTHNWEDFATFRITARGTQQSVIHSGRSGKTEWKGDWEGAATVVADGWTAEMVIPWGVLSYVSSDEPKTLGFNVERNHAHKKVASMFSNTGPAWRHEYAGNWLGVELPEGGFSPELLALPFLAAGVADVDDAWEGTARGGLDLRYRPTPQLTTVLTLNPDFKNVQGEVEGIDFSRGEQWVNESRPFFQEGSNVFRTWSGIGDYFYSRRIEHVDMGAKVYGKLGKRTNVGMIGAFDFADQFESRDPWELHRQDYVGSVAQGFGEDVSISAISVLRRDNDVDNTVLGYSGHASLLDNRLGLNLHYGSSRFDGIDEDEDDDEDEEDTGLTEGPSETVSLRGDLARLSMGWYDGKYWVDARWTFLSPGFRARDGLIEHPGRRGVGLAGGYWNEFRDSYITHGGIDIYTGYEERYVVGAGYEDLGGILKRTFSTIGDRSSNERFFNDNIGYWTGWNTRSNLSFGSRGSVGHWRDEPDTPADLDWALNFNFSAGNEAHTRQGKIEYGFGRADGTFRHFVSFGGSVKHDQITLDYHGSVLRHQDRLHQHILGATYDLSTTMTIGGRLVFAYDELEDKATWNPYVSFRRSGEAGIETFLILGDPSGDEFAPRLEGKVLFPI